MRHTVSRRKFLEQASLGAAVAFAPRSLQAAQTGRWKIIAFSKPFINLSFEQTADLVADVGWDGIECPVRRASTHVVPERVADDLPKMVDALKRRGREVSMITTDITAVDPSAELILRTAAKLGIRTYRLGPIRYVANRSIPDQLAEIKARLRDLAQLNQTLGIKGGIQNHSGQDYFAAPVWDAVQVIQGMERDLGIAFDIGHATVEGGLSWPIQARLAEPHFTVVYVKDFRWEKQESGWRSVWCPLGDGMVNRKFFATLASSRYAGAICQHHEYDLGKTPAENVAHFKRDLQTLREWLKAASA
jgi:sugar phosphate isomerase/epimerase